MIFSVGLVDIDGLYALLDACLLSYYLDVIHCCEDKCEGAVSCNLCSQVHRLGDIWRHATRL